MHEWVGGKEPEVLCFRAWLDWTGPHRTYLREGRRLEGQRGEGRGLQVLLLLLLLLVSTLVARLQCLGVGVGGV